MPSQSLMLMGLLSKYPLKSPSLTKLTAGGNYHYTDREKMHIVATQFTPGLPKSWVDYQFERLGFDAPRCRRRLNYVAYRYRAKWDWLGPNNVQFIGLPEVIRYYERRPPHLRASHPGWAVAGVVQMVKEKGSLVRTAERLGLSQGVVSALVHRRSMFQSNAKRPGGNPEFLIRKG